MAFRARFLFDGTFHYAFIAVASLALVLPGFFSSVQASSTLNFPRLSFEQNTLTGIAIVNPSSQDAAVILTAYGTDGQPLSGSGFQNPVPVTVRANQQFSRQATELFGSSLDPSKIGWFQATSSVDELTGFFLFLNGPPITLFDGADLPESAAKIIFNKIQIDSGSSSELNIINPSGASTDVEIQLVGPDSSRLSEKTLTLPPKGIVRLDAASFFAVTTIPDGTYVSASSEAEIAGFEFVKSANGDLLGLNARNAAEQLSTLYFPQMAVLGPWKTELGLVNYSGQASILTISAYKPDGTLYGAENLKNNPVTLGLESGHSLRADVETMFGFSGNAALDGWIKIESTSAAINGYVTYGMPSVGSVAAVASAAVGRTKAIFSHIATTQNYYTGVAVLNSGTLAANVRIMALRPDGQVLGSFDTVLQPRQRISRLIDQYIPAAANQSGGIIWVSGDAPVYLTSLFGSVADPILANIPPQGASDSYRPDAGRLSLKLSPSLTSLSVGSVQNFSIQGGSGTFVWKVNGIAGGNSTFGTINPTGSYRAPSSIPSPLPATVTAEQGAQIVGASVDIQPRALTITGLGLVQSVVYLSSLKKLYSAELASIAGAKPLATQPQAATTTNSTVFEVSPPSVRISVAAFNNETIPKAVSFAASDGKEYILLAGKTGGRIIRLNPATRESSDVVTGLNQPTALVMDPATGNLLVADQSGISIIARTSLETGLVFPAKSAVPDPRVGLALIPTVASAGGIAVDSCTGKIYFSDSSGGRVAVYDRATGQVTTVVSGLRDPGQLLAVYRSEVSCPDSLQIFAVERGANRILLLLKDGSVSTWLQSSVPIDVSFLPKDNPFASSEAILVATNDQVSVGQIAIVPIPASPAGGAPSGTPSGLYSDSPINSPAGSTESMQATEPGGSPGGFGTSVCFARVFFADPDLETAVRRALKIDATAPITCDLAKTLSFLDATNFRKSASAEEPPIITSLRGLEAFPNLTGLILSANQVRDLRPLAHLYKLKQLNLEGNAISDIRFLSGLDSLKALNLRRNLIGSVLKFGRPLQPLSENYGLGPGDAVDLTANKLTTEDCPDLQQLINLGVSVTHDVACPNTVNLSISKSASPDPAVLGNDLTYTVSVTNNGGGTATAVAMTDTLPAGVAFASAISNRGTCSQSAGTVTCSIGTLAGGSGATMTIVVIPGITGTITNTAGVTSKEADSDPSNNTVKLSSTVSTPLLADLSISKTASPEPVTVGNKLAYTIVVRNNGPSDASGAVVSDTLPSGVSLGSANSTQGSCTQAVGVVTCNIGGLASGTSATVTIVATPNVAGIINNTASVKASENDPTPANNSATARSTVNPPVDLSISKSDSPDPVTVGNNLTYTIVVSNGPAPDTGVVVADTLPANVTFVSAMSTQGNCSLAGSGIVTCNLGSMAASAAATITIVVTPTVAGTISNTATVKGNEPDANQANNTAAVTTTVNPAADLSVTKSDSPDPVIAGNNLTYMVVVTNNGPSPSTGVTLTDILPATVTFVSASSTQGTCPQSGGTVICGIGSLNNRSTATMTIVVTPSAAGSITNTASVRANETDPNSANNSATASTTVLTQADLSVTKSDSPDPVNMRSTLTYTIVANNAGPSTATGVTLTDTLPSNVTFRSATPSQGTCSLSGGVVTCVLGTLLRNGSATATIVVVPNSPGAITNTASISGKETDPNSANNSASVSTTVNALFDLFVTKSAKPNPVTAGTNLTYTVSISNLDTAPAAAPGVVLTDKLPSTVNFISASSTQGACSQSGGVVTCNIGTLALGGGATVTIVVVPQAAGTITNTVSATAIGTDTDPSTNSASDSTFVNPGTDLSVTKTDSPDPVINGGNLTYTIVVTNNGPSTNSSVTLTDTLPTSMTFVSASSTQGSCTQLSATVNCSLGAMGSGSLATVTIVVRHTAPLSSPITVTNMRRLAARRQTITTTIIQRR
jgi:uncharacterized repeat protein (TIGR01451 family)